jgi:hypothetical protein
VNLVHGLPEEKGAEGHREVGRHPHHLRLALRSLAPADLDWATAASLPVGMDGMRSDYGLGAHRVDLGLISFPA